MTISKIKKQEKMHNYLIDYDSCIDCGKFMEEYSLRGFQCYRTKQHRIQDDHCTGALHMYVYGGRRIYS